jgi:hypothetical protein
MPAKERLRLNAKSPARKRRYEFAATIVEESDIVLDCACGSRYGEGVFKNWIGVDKSKEANPKLVRDLETWEADFPFDVFVGMETIEHLRDFRSYVRTAKRARKYIALSAPIVPTVHINTFHKQDLTKEEIIKIFEDPEWKLGQYEELTNARGIVSGLFLFKRLV